MYYTKLSKMMRRLLINLLLFPVFLSFAVEGDPVDPPVPPADPPSDPPPGNDPPPADDLSTLFTPELIEARKQEIAANKAEEDRRAALTDDERKAEDEAKAAAEKANGGAPEAYEDFKIPEGMEAAKELLGEFKPLLKDELNLSQEKAQKLIDFYTTKVLPEMQAKGIAASTEAWNNELTERTNAIKSDPEIGGEKFDKSVEAVNRVANTFLTPEESTEMMDYFKRFGDCKPFLKLLVRQSAAMKEGGIIMSGTGGGGGGERSHAERIYDAPKQ